MYIERTKYKHVKEEVLPLLKDHWDEVGCRLLEPDGDNNTGLHINDEAYVLLDKLNAHLSYALRDDGTAKMVGYLSIVVHPNYHARGTLSATTDCFFIIKSKRGVATYRQVVEMFRQAEKVLKDEYKVEYFNFACSAYNDVSRLGRNMGFKDSSIVLVKRL